MRKADIVNRITEKTGLEKVDVMVVVEAFCKEIKETMAEGNNVYLRGFGSFVVKTRKKKIGRNIKKNIAVEIPEQKMPSFKPAQLFIDRVKNGKKPK
ncbi:MAG TPA: HU family DNA-binding protein [Chitinophagales bacterium]|jgi:DNA-binding protein HU-beta|nr:HU family DNA-binding protein [Chitinophagales bacterium]